MSLRIEELSLDEFRGYSHFALSGVGQVTVLVGPNAVGKTNIVEGIELLTSGESFRRPAWGETVSWGAESARLSARFVDGARDVEHVLTIRGNERRYEVNGKRRNAAGIRGTCPCVLFIPDDLQLVKASSARRRDALDAFAGQLSRKFAALRSEYRATLRQRNALLKEGMGSGALFESWGEALAERGARLVAARTRLFARLAAQMEEIYPQVVPGERLDVRYVPSWERFDARGAQLGDAPRLDALPACGAVAVTEARERLSELGARVAGAEAARRTTLFGPHKDEVAFFIGGANARLFASQGQQRTIVLVWKLAELALAREMTDQAPVLLLDDVMSELDAARRDALTSFIEESAQTFITTTNLGYFSADLLGKADVVELPVPGTRHEYRES